MSEDYNAKFEIQYQDQLLKYFYVLIDKDRVPFYTFRFLARYYDTSVRDILNAYQRKEIHVTISILVTLTEIRSFAFELRGQMLTTRGYEHRINLEKDFEKACLNQHSGGEFDDYNFYKNCDLVIPLITKCHKEDSFFFFMDGLTNHIDIKIPKKASKQVKRTEQKPIRLLDCLADPNWVEQPPPQDSFKMISSTELK